MLLLALAGTGARPQDGPHQGKARATPLSAEEAQVLAYLSPPAVALRAAHGGCDVALAPQRGNPEFYVFWLLNSCVRQNGIPGVAYVAVNRRTAQVWDATLAKRLRSRLLAGVQRIVRRCHHITRETIARYGQLRPPL